MTDDRIIYEACS